MGSRQRHGQWEDDIRAFSAKSDRWRFTNKIDHSPWFDDADAKRHRPRCAQGLSALTYGRDDFLRVDYRH